MATTAAIVQDLKGGARRHIRLIALLTIVLLLAGGWVAIDRGASGWYVIQPGARQITINPGCKANSSGTLTFPDGVACARLNLPAGRGHPIAGSLYMVDVLVGPATPWEYALWKVGLKHLLSQGTQFTPKSAVLGNTPASQLTCQDTQQMTDATSSAAVVALRRLGYTVRENDLGARLDLILPGYSAAAGGLKCNDVVVALNGTPVHTNTDLARILASHAPGQTVRVTVQRAGRDGKLQTKTLPVKLGSTPASNGQAALPHRAFLGVELSTRVTFTLPFNVTVDVGGIGGPSAGLALTLGLLDVLSNGQLTGGKRIAATGTINLDGTVGDVGGVAQKAVAVRRAGAQAFLVPVQELSAARSGAGSMKVYAVSTLQQALGVLQTLGGHPPPVLTGHN